MSNLKTYLGDSVYADFDGYTIRLFLNNGGQDKSIIYLEPEVVDAFINFKERIDNERREHFLDNSESA